MQVVAPSTTYYYRLQRLMDGWAYQFSVLVEGDGQPEHNRRPWLLDLNQIHT